MSSGKSDLSDLTQSARNDKVGLRAYFEARVATIYSLFIYLIIGVVIYFIRLITTE